MDEEFLGKYRMHRESFHAIVEQIRGHPIFQSDTSTQYCTQAPVKHQLMIFLYYIGRSGSGANNPTLRKFGIGRGTADLYKRRVTIAICSLKGTIVVWPNEQERVQIALRIKEKYHWLKVCGIIDGTLLTLKMPQTTVGVNSVTPCR